MACNHQRRGSFVVHRLDVGSMVVEQQPRHRLVTLTTCGHQRGMPIVRRFIVDDVGSTAVVDDKQPHGHLVALLARVEQSASNDPVRQTLLGPAHQDQVKACEARGHCSKRRLYPAGRLEASSHVHRHVHRWQASWTTKASSSGMLATMRSAKCVDAN